MHGFDIFAGYPPVIYSNPADLATAIYALHDNAKCFCCKGDIDRGSMYIIFADLNEAAHVKCVCKLLEEYDKVNPIQGGSP